MKRFHLLLLALVALSLADVKPAHAGATPPAIVSSSTTEALTQAAPTGAVGLDLTGALGYRLTVCAASGQTLMGGGSLDAYVWNTALSLWARAPGLDVTLTVTQNNRCAAFPDVTTSVARGRIYFAATRVTVSGGTTLTVVLEGTQR